MISLLQPVVGFGFKLFFNAKVPISADAIASLSQSLPSFSLSPSSSPNAIDVDCLILILIFHF